MRPLLLAVLLASLACSGCQPGRGDDDENRLPGSRPASWEGGMPGLQGLGTGGR